MASFLRVGIHVIPRAPCLSHFAEQALVQETPWSHLLANATEHLWEIRQLGNQLRRPPSRRVYFPTAVMLTILGVAARYGWNAALSWGSFSMLLAAMSGDGGSFSKFEQDHERLYRHWDPLQRKLIEIDPNGPGSQELRTALAVILVGRVADLAPLSAFFPAEFIQLLNEWEDVFVEYGSSSGFSKSILEVFIQAQKKILEGFPLTSAPPALPAPAAQVVKRMEHPLAAEPVRREESPQIDPVVYPAIAPKPPPDNVAKPWKKRTSPTRPRPKQFSASKDYSNASLPILLAWQTVLKRLSEHLIPQEISTLDEDQLRHCVAETYDMLLETLQTGSVPSRFEKYLRRIEDTLGKKPRETLTHLQASAEYLHTSIEFHLNLTSQAIQQKQAEKPEVDLNTHPLAMVFAMGFSVIAWVRGMLPGAAPFFVGLSLPILGIASAMIVLGIVLVIAMKWRRQKSLSDAYGMENLDAHLRQIRAVIGDFINSENSPSRLDVAKIALKEVERREEHYGIYTGLEEHLEAAVQIHSPDSRAADAEPTLKDLEQVTADFVRIHSPSPHAEAIHRLALGLDWPKEDSDNSAPGGATGLLQKETAMAVASFLAISIAWAYAEPFLIPLDNRHEIFRIWAVSGYSAVVSGFFDDRIQAQARGITTYTSARRRTLVRTMLGLLLVDLLYSGIVEAFIYLKVLHDLPIVLSTLLEVLLIGWGLTDLLVFFVGQVIFNGLEEGLNPIDRKSHDVAVASIRHHLADVYILALPGWIPSMVCTMMLPVPTLSFMALNAGIVWWNMVYARAMRKNFQGLPERYKKMPVIGPVYNLINGFYAWNGLLGWIKGWLFVLYLTSLDWQIYLWEYPALVGPWLAWGGIVAWAYLMRHVFMPRERASVSSFQRVWRAAIWFLPIAIYASVLAANGNTMGGGSAGGDLGLMMIIGGVAGSLFAFQRWLRRLPQFPPRFVAYSA